MNSKLYTLNKLIVGFCIAVFFCSCANIIPPSGGIKDTIPPALIVAFPKDSCTNFNAKKITLTFNEYVEARDIQQNLVVNPLPKNLPNVDYKLQNVFVTLKDSLEPNTTYTINFGNAIKDVNEGNLAKNKTYTFSTGNYIDSNSISGKVIIANTGKTDSSLVAVLYDNLNDSAVKKLKPKYLVKLDGKGFFKFTNLPAAKFNLFILPNDYSKKYDDSTKVFAFLDKPIYTRDSVTSHTLYAYKEVEPIEKPNTPKQSEDKNKTPEKLKLTTSLVNNKFDVLDTALTLSFNKKIKSANLKSVVLTDTNYNQIKNYKTFFDTSKNTITIDYSFPLDTKFYLLIDKSIVTDTLNNTLSKNDTVKFATLDEKNYGSIKLRCNQNANNAVLQVISNGKLFMSLPLTAKEIFKKLFKPGDYELRVLLDENQNGIWDAGNYNQKKQPEKVIALTTKLLIKANWDNELELTW